MTEYPTPDAGLDPQIAELLRGLEAQPPMHRTPLATLRARRAAPGLESPAVGAVRDLTCTVGSHDVPARLYTPHMPGTAALVVFFHGGGFVFGSLDGHYDNCCRALCAGAGCHVLSVDYRLAPEHRFPAAVDDGIAALRWAAASAAALGADPRRIVVAGGSAGGNLAAVTALRARDEGGPPVCGQLLFYPVTDHPERPTASYREFAEGFYLTRADMEWFWDQYLPGSAEVSHPYAAPLRAPALDALPPALVITAGHDPLRDEGEAYAARLREAGVPVVLSRYPRMVHGFLAFPVPDRAHALAEAAAWLRALVPADERLAPQGSASYC